MPCRVVYSTKTGEKVNSEAWDQIFEITNDEKASDKLYSKLLTPQFKLFFGDWTEEIMPNTYNNGEPMIVNGIITNYNGEKKSIFNSGSFLSSSNDGVSISTFIDESNNDLEGGEINVTKVFQDGREIGLIYSENDGSYLTTFDVSVTRGRPNAGTYAILQLAEEAKLKGLQLRSDRISDRMSEAYIRLWNRFLDAGQAHVENDRYIFTGSKEKVENDSLDTLENNPKKQYIQYLKSLSDENNRKQQTPKNFINSERVDDTVLENNTIESDKGWQPIPEEQLSTTYVVFEPEQIHILGSQADIQGFKDFIQGRQFQKLTAEEKAKTIEQVTKEHRSIAALKDLGHKLAHRIGGKVEFVNRTDVDWKAYNQGMKSMLNEAYMTPDTPFHEILGHPIIRAIKNTKTISEEQFRRDVYEGKRVLEYGDSVLTGYSKYLKSQLPKTSRKIYDSLIKELETGRGKEVFEQVKRDYKYKLRPSDWDITITSNGKYKVFDTNDIAQESVAKDKNNNWVFFNTKEEAENFIGTENYTLEEQQEEAIVTLLGMMAADKLDAKKDATLISKLKELWKQISDFVKSLLRQDGIKIDELPITTTLNDLAEIMAYGNNKIILPGYKVEYSTPLGNKYDTLEEVNNEIRGLADGIINDIFLNENQETIFKEVLNLNSIYKNSTKAQLSNFIIQKEQTIDKMLNQLEKNCN